MLQKHITNVNLLMQKTIANYINTYVTKDADATSFAMYADDVAHNINALQQFNATLDADLLQDAIIKQDTLVRECFYSTLKYLEQQNLVTRTVCK